MQQLAQEAEVAVEEGCVPRGADPDVRDCRWGEQGLSPHAVCTTIMSRTSTSGLSPTRAGASSESDSSTEPGFQSHRACSASH